MSEVAGCLWHRMARPNATGYCRSENKAVMYPYYD